MWYWTFPSPVGMIWLLNSGRGLSLLAFSRDVFFERVRGFKGSLSRDHAPFREVVERLEAYFRGEMVEFSGLSLDLHGTPFDMKVWRVLQEIPYGEVRTYGWIAGRLGRPGGARAVGQSCRRNPIPIVVPCHRVVKEKGGIGGYSSGEEIKRILLRIEGHEEYLTHRGARDRQDHHYKDPF